jgi:predicted short-subunit dehydrogenase-like oxidoreductase (DUF2520 family)
MTRTIVIVGAGKVGTAIAVLLQRAGYPVVGIASRTLESAKKAAGRLDPPPEFGDVPAELTRKAEVVLITTRDDAIETACEAIAEREGFREGQIVLHVSGSLPSTILSPAKEKGAFIGSMHPLQSFADVDVAIETLGGSYFCLEGDKEAIEAAKELALSLKGQIMTIKTEDKPIYHAAAVIASNFFVSIIDMSLRFYEAIGIDREGGLEALMPLIKGSLNNIGALGPVKALTGPIARGDVGVVKSHLEAIERVIPEALQAYKALAAINVDVGIRKGTLSKEAADRILTFLNS